MPPHARSPGGLSRALYDEIRARIADGTFAPDAALPSTRALAAERGVSRATVTLVYEQLAADGFIDTRSGAASTVAAGAVPAATARALSALPATQSAAAGFGGTLSHVGQHVAAMHLPHPAPARAGEIDFVYGPLAGGDFPTLAWLRALRTAEGQRGARLAYDDPRGSLALRRALQAHLSQTRGLSCTVDQLLIVSGSQQALDLCARLLLNPGDTVVIENPGYRMAHHAFAAYGARLHCVDVDEHGLQTDALPHAPAGPAAQVAYVTPTHQFPLGGSLPIGRRRALLAWAAQQRAWVIEDDYDSEYRYTVRPEATLQALDAHGCVIHVGTFSKTLSPLLRVGYMVLPAQLAAPFAAAKRLTDRHAATGVQGALALLLEDGSYARHVRRIRRLQQARQKTLVDALGQHLGPRAQVQGDASGLHLVAWLTDLPAGAEPALVQACQQTGVRVHPIGPLYHPGSAAAAARGHAGLVMGYASLAREEIEEGVRRLARALDRVMPGWAGTASR